MVKEPRKRKKNITNWTRQKVVLPGWELFQDSISYCILDFTSKSKIKFIYKKNPEKACWSTWNTAKKTKIRVKHLLKLSFSLKVLVSAIFHQKVYNIKVLSTTNHSQKTLNAFSLPSFNEYKHPLDVTSEAMREPAYSFGNIWKITLIPAMTAADCKCPNEPQQNSPPGEDHSHPKPSDPAEWAGFTSLTRVLTG